MASHPNGPMPGGPGFRVGKHEECQVPDCPEIYEVTHHRQKFCPEHRWSPAQKKETLQRIEMTSERFCQNPKCQKRIVGERASKRSVKYCSSKCGTQVNERRKYLKKKNEKQRKVRAAEAFETSTEAATATRPRPNSRLGDVYDRIKANPEMEQLLVDGKMPHTVAANYLNCTEGAVSRAMEAILFDREMAERREEWGRSAETVELLPQDVLTNARKVVPLNPQTPEAVALVERLVESYVAFQNEFFEIAPGVRFIVKDFHREWIRLIIVAWLTGGKQLILSPPRHGKSELLIRFVVWAICLDFNVRIMWVAANSDVAKLMLGAVKDHLENNEPLVQAVLPPGEAFRPGRTSGKPWTGSEIRIAQLDVIGQKSSTMLALGQTSKILSRDVDILIVDDLEDFDSTREPGGREYARNKFAEIGTRKEEHTMWVDICSRQHPEDLASALMDSSSKQAWGVKVDAAHDENCGKDPEEWDAHTDCVLFPEVRSYRWLMEKKQEMDDLGVAGAYDMRYLNAPRPTKGLVFRVETIRELCLDRSRDLGVEGIPPGRMIAGLDPAARGTQAAFGWLWTPNMLYMIDLETQEAGGFEGALRVMQNWDDLYDMKDWKYESNFQQVEFFSDPRLKKLNLERSISVKPYQTGKNKQDPELGLSSMAPPYHEGRINLPYGTPEARRKVNMFLRQLQNWTTEGSIGKHKTDIKMASWFPWPTIIRWNRESRDVSLTLGSESSYPGITRMADAAWHTNYPGQM